MRRPSSSKLVAPTLPGFQSNYYATNKYDTDYRKYDGKITWVPNNRITVNGRLGYATSYEDSAPALPYVETDGAVTNGPNNPIWQGRIWDSTVHSHSLAITSIVSTNLVVDGVFGFTRTDMLARPHTDDCWGDLFDIPNTCQPPYGRSTAFPAMNASTLVDLRRRRAARVSRPAMGREPERRLDQGRATT